MKSVIKAMVLCVCLAACAAVPSADEHIPANAQALVQSARVAELSVVKSEKQTIAYYDPEGNVVAAPVKGGFYRVLHGYDGKGRPVVQDFYQDSQTQQANAAVIADAAKINSFAVEDTVGRTVWYSPAGEIRSFADIENGRAVRGGYYDKGVLRFSVYEPDEKRMRKVLYYADGRPKVVFAYDGQQETYTVYDEQGRILGVSDAKQALPKVDSPHAKTVKAALMEFFTLSVSPQY